MCSQSSIQAFRVNRAQRLPAVRRSGRRGGWYRCLVMLAACALVMATAGCSRSWKLDRHMNRARRFEAGGNYPAAVIEYINVLRIDASNMEAMRQLGLCYYETGDYGRAAACLLKAAEGDPHNTAVNIKLARLLLAGQRFEEAREQAARALESDPTSREGLLLLAEASRSTNAVTDALAVYEAAGVERSPDAMLHVALGQLHFRQHALDKAEQEFRHALQLEATNSAAHSAMARLYTSQNKDDQAIQSFETAVDLAGPDSPEAMSFADFLLARGQGDRAEKLLSRTLEISPENWMAWWGLARAAYQRQDYRTCLDYAEKVLARNPGHPGANALTADAKLASGLPDAAIAGYEQLLKRFPNSANLHAGLARAYLAKDDQPRAMAQLRTALALSPDDTASSLLLAQLQLRAGNVVAATKRLEALVAGAAPPAAAFTMLASAYEAAGRFVDAVAVLQELAKLRPDDPETVYRLGRANRAAGRDEAATAAFEEALSLDPGFFPALAQLVAPDVAGGKRAEVLARVEAQVARQPEDARLLSFVGRLHMVWKNWAEAEKALRKAIDLEANTAEPYLLLSRLYRSTGKLPEALKEAQAALAVSPEDFPALILAASLYTAGGDEANAIALYERVLELRPESVLALNNLAVLYGRQSGKLDAAYRLAKTAHDLAPLNSSVADTLGWIQYSRGEYRDAVAQLKESVRQNPENPGTLYHLGVAQCALGNETAALQALEAALAPNSMLDERDQAEKRVGILRIGLDSTFDPQTIERLEAAVREDPHNAAALLRLGAAREQDGDWDAAANYYRRVLASRPSHVLALKAVARLCLDRLDDLKAALAAAKKARELSPGDPDALLLLGRAAYKAGDFQWALSLVRESTVAAPDRAEAQYYLGLANYARGYLGQAKEALQRALALNADFPQAADARRIVALMEIVPAAKGREAAKRLIDDSLTADPRDVPALMASAALHVADRETGSAREVYERIGKFRPAFAPAMAELALIYADMEGKIAEAMELATKARQLLPGDPRAAEALGTVACRQGDYEWASSLLSEALRASTPTPELLYRLGESEFLAGKKADARRHLTRALQLATADFPYARQAEKMLAELDVNATAPGAGPP